MEPPTADYRKTPYTQMDAETAPPLSEHQRIGLIGVLRKSFIHASTQPKEKP
ncbi:hypothetical protein [Actinomadura sp. SCN-SB]|uniref:hypothetical protein n=1 Tax=Actinomadura sp. SCN-SB TaxID=3373092 RepID=UPI003750B883